MARFFCQLLCLFFLSGTLLAQEQHKTASPIYQHTDEKGRVVYSNKPASDFEENIALPEITKENLDERIEDIKKATPLNCENHGGVSCSLGEDQDGSVICLDGFREAEEKFIVLCTNAKLKIVSLYLKNEEGKVIELDERANFVQQVKTTNTVALLVSIYNATGVEARDVEVKIRERRIEYLQASGLMNIKSYEVQDYLFPVSGLLKIAKLKNITRGMIHLSCRNCR
ncbi:MAG: DUF4124 domain-containing protein [Deltaproteobacteria bacterium]|nr:DUF4124 domain-containing protein [Deltaproteobacteria bacterium]